MTKSKVSVETVHKDRMINCVIAEEKSSKASSGMLPLLRERNRSLTTIRRANSVLWLGQYDDWKELYGLCELG